MGEDNKEFIEALNEVIGRLTFKSFIIGLITGVICTLIIMI